MPSSELASIGPNGGFIENDGPDLVCFSHLRWGFVFQRPQHLLTRWAHERRVWFIEEPIFEAIPTHRVSVTRQSGRFGGDPPPARRHLSTASG